MDRICARLASDYAGKQRVLVLNDMFGSFASDIITKLAFAKSYDFIEQPEFRSDLSNGVKNMVQTAHMTTQFPIMVSLMNALPDWLVCKGFPIMEPVLKFRGVWNLPLLDFLFFNYFGDAWVTQGRRSHR